MKSDHRIGFVADGYDRARSAVIESIRIEVEHEFAERLMSVGWFERLKLHREMQREIEKRLDRVAPPWGLYFLA